jgi:hypothetical protein
MKIAAGELFSWGEATAKRLVEGNRWHGRFDAEEYLAPHLLALRMMMRAIGQAGRASWRYWMLRRVLALWDASGAPGARMVFDGLYNFTLNG